MKMQWLDEWVDCYKAEFEALSLKVWDYAETGLEEIQSAAELKLTLQSFGFTVEENLAGLPTAFVGSFGEGSPVIGILGEFDALEGLSQKACSPAKVERKDHANGHGCGHNLLGVGSLAAAAAVKAALEQRGLKGTVKYFGCPGEEKGCGKTYMMRAGCFSGLDAILTWHPSDMNEIEGKGSLADLCIKFHFTGKAAHAAACPHLGRSALDAVELLNVGCNYMREHMIPEARIHYAVTNSGGTSPNIVPAHAEVLYEVRAPRLREALELRERVCKAAKGAALMTETEVDISFGDGYSDYIPNDVLNQVAWGKMIETGVPKYTQEEIKFADNMQKTFENGDGERQSGNASLADHILPYEGLGGTLPASTDVGDASYAAPTVQIYTACYAKETPGHSWQMVSQTAAPAALKGMLMAAKVLALTAWELLEQPDILVKAKEEHRLTTKGGYICPI